MVDEDRQSETGSTKGLFRRSVLRLAGAAAGLGALGTGSAAGMPGNKVKLSSRRRITKRINKEFNRRTKYANYQLKKTADRSAHDSNSRFNTDSVVAKFGKSLPHDDKTGLPTTDAYDALVGATETGGKATAYPDIPQAYDGSPETDSRPLVQPETAWTYQTEGGSTAQLRIAVPPAFDDPGAGAEMVELYWRALTRDVNFYDYESDEAIESAAAELDKLDAYNGPGADGKVTPDNVFRGVTPGATTGPYVSQFLWKDRNLGGGVEGQKIEVLAEEDDYMTEVDDWLAVQRGRVPKTNEFAEARYLITGRDMCERVHDDPPFRQIQKAAQVLIFTMNAPLDPTTPYTLKPFSSGGNGDRSKGNFVEQTTLPFNDFGPLYIEKKALEATEQGQKAAWHKKWNVHRRLRPEEYGGRVQAVNGKRLAPDGYSKKDIPSNLLNSDALKRTYEEFDSYLLPQAYSEGSPTHPSYPAGHSAVAGAGTTVLKALFDDEYEFPDEQKVVPTRDGSELKSATETDALGVDETLTVGGELNKLASNMALGRNRAGIHYRTDGIEGLRLGEATAIRYLQDQLSLPDRIPGADNIELSFEPFVPDKIGTLHKELFDGERVVYDGEKVRIKPAVEPTG